MKTKLFLYCPALLMLLFTTYVNAQWQADLIKDGSRGHLLVVDLPEDIDINTLARLAVELDGIDITAAMGFEDGDFTYTPLEPLASGPHLLKLVLLAEEGQQVIQQWHFETTQRQAGSAEAGQEISNRQLDAAESWLRSGHFNSDNSVELSQRYADHNTPSDTRHFVMSGAGLTSGAVQGDNWEVSARANYFLQSEQDLSLTGNSLDIGEYQLSAKRQDDWGETRLRLGDQSLGLNSALLSPYQRRGASLQLTDANERISTQIFALRPDALVGADHFTGLSEPESRIEGFTASVKPFSADAEALTVTTVYYDGEGSATGAGISNGESLAEGRGWSLALDKNLFEGKLSLFGEYAHASYDSDGDAGAAERENSEAYTFLMESYPFEDLRWHEQPVDWMFGLRYERIDTFFASLANPGLAADRDVTSAYSHLYWNRFSANLHLSHETNNVDDLTGLPTDRLRNASWSSTYAFEQQQDGLAWLGSPYLQFSGFVARLDREETPDNYQGVETDNASNSATVSVGSNYQRSYVNAAYTWSEFEDHAEVSSDTVSHFISLGGGWRPSDRLSFNTDVQYGTFETRLTRDKAYTTNVNFGVRSLLIPNKLDFALNYNLNLAGGDNDSPDRHLLNAELGWTYLTASKNNPGVAFVLRGALEQYHGHEQTTLYEDNYQAFAIVRITAPFSGRR
ncbi:hypothetical protein [Methylophaga sp.]|uniref:hypothetical protein n=1 Tax=Methylophaga sp. TaxID=2024840 RepID=UPI003F696D3C